MHWSFQYLKYSFAQLNCAELVELVLKEIFNKPYKLPQTMGSIYKDSEQIKKRLVDYVDGESKVKKEGDLIIMSGSTRLCHVGILVIINKKNYVLHSMKKAGTVCLHKFEDINKYGLIINGVYSWQKL